MWGHGLIFLCMSGLEGSFGNLRKMGGCFSHQPTLYVVHIFRQRFFWIKIFNNFIFRIANNINNKYESFIKLTCLISFKQPNSPTC